VRSGTIKKRESIVPETIKKRLESYPGWSDLVRLRKKRAQCILTLHLACGDTDPPFRLCVQLTSSW